MQTIGITKEINEEIPQWLKVKIEFLKTKFEVQFRIVETTADEPNEDIVLENQIEKEVTATAESPEEAKRRKAREYYAANKERLREDAKRRYQTKKANTTPVVIPELVDDVLDNTSQESQESLVFDYDPSLTPSTEVRQYRDNYYQTHLAEIRQYYQDNKERIAKRQQTDEVRAKNREQYHARRATLTPAQIATKNSIATAQRKVREAKLRAKYPDCRTLKAAKALEKAKRM